MLYFLTSQNQNMQGTPPPVNQVKESSLYIKDLDKTEAFYHGKLGFPIIGKSVNRHIFFRAGNSVLLCFISETTKSLTDLPPHFGEGKLHIAFGCQPEDYENWKATLIQNQIEITHEQAWGDGYFSCYFEDPDGHVLEIVPEGMWERGL